MIRKMLKPMFLTAVSLFAIGVFMAAPTTAPEAPQGFDGLTNGSVAQATMDGDAATFSEIEQPSPDGLGPVYNAVSCTDCHQSIAVGGASQVLEFRAGHNDGGRPSWFLLSATTETPMAVPVHLWPPPRSWRTAAQFPIAR